MSMHKTEGFVRAFDPTFRRFEEEGTIADVTLRLQLDVTLTKLTPAQVEVIERRSRARRPLRVTVGTDHEDAHDLAVEMARMALSFAEDRCAEESEARARQVLMLLGVDP